MNSINDIVFYTLLGGWCGDSIGATLEFQKRRFSQEEVLNAMEMKSIGFSGVYPGQITDDSELEIALMNGIIAGCKCEYFPSEFIAKEYIKWYDSDPFDIGQTTTFALLDAENELDMYNNSKLHNIDSESNGSLMRCIPLAVILMNKPEEDIMEITAFDTELTHPNIICVETTGLYCIIISFILKHRLQNLEIDIDKLFGIIRKHASNKTVISWIKKSIGLKTINQYNCIKQEGHVKHAFIFVLFFLRNIHNYNYETAIMQILTLGGDTDTNAKIVGNLFGAFYGNCVPEYMRTKVLNFDSTIVSNEYFRRPPKYCIKYNSSIVNKLVSVIRK